MLVLLSACEGLTGVTEKSVQLPDGSSKFASGTKSVRINLSNRPSTGIEPKGSFTSSSTDVTPPSAPEIIPSGYPGYDGASTYYPGVSATYYFDVDGSTPISKPDWVRDIQVGFLNDPDDASICSMFGKSSSTVPHFFQTSEYNCHGQPGGTGSGQDRTFIRILLNRDQAYIGTKENLLVQLEYDATGLRLNPDHLDSTSAAPVSGITNPEGFVDQLWKIFSGSSLASGATVSPFAMVIPPNHAYHCAGGQGGSFTGCNVGSATPSTTVRQFVFPLSSLPKAAYIQISRVRGGRLMADGTSQDTAFYSSTCGGTFNNNPYCLGVVFRSLTLIRI
jgi:hypothetical protein